MKRSQLLPFCLAALVLVPTILGAEVNRSWETLIATLERGRTVVVTQHSGKRAEGKVLSLTYESVTIETGAQQSLIRREEVFRVRIAGIRSRNSLIGLGLGAGAGVAFGANLGSRRHGLSAAVFGSVFGGLGASAGAAMPVGNPLYEAPGGLRKTGP